MQHEGLLSMAAPASTTRLPSEETLTTSQRPFITFSGRCRRRRSRRRGSSGSARRPDVQRRQPWYRRLGSPFRLKVGYRRRDRPTPTCVTDGVNRTHREPTRPTPLSSLMTRGMRAAGRFRLALDRPGRTLSDQLCGGGLISVRPEVDDPARSGIDRDEER